MNKEQLRKELEDWFPVKGFEGLYEVTKNGKVRSILRNAIVKPQLAGKGYDYARLANGKVVKNIAIHRIVALTFIPNPKNLKEVNHKNAIKTDNSVENLEWTTRRGNLQHAWDLGLKRQGSTIGNSKLTEAKVIELRERYAKGELLIHLSKESGICKWHLGEVLNGKCWKHVPMPLKTVRKYAKQTV